MKPELHTRQHQICSDAFEIARQNVQNRRFFRKSMSDSARFFTHSGRMRRSEELLDDSQAGVRLIEPDEMSGIGDDFTAAVGRELGHFPGEGGGTLHVLVAIDEKGWRP